MIIDVHCHLDICEDVEKAVKNAKDNDVLIVSDGIDKKTNRISLDFVKKYGIKACLGVFPLDALAMSEKELEEEIEFIKKNKKNIVGIGEVGLDYHEDEGKDKDKQKKIFEKFIELAKELDLPIVVHTRKAELDCIEILEKLQAKKVLMHCFSGKLSLVKRIEANGWYLSVPTNVVYSEHFQKVVKNVDINRLLCETDSPFLHPFKERNNEPANVIESYKKIAEIKGLDLKETSIVIENNFKRLFN